MGNEPPCVAVDSPEAFAAARRRPYRLTGKCEGRKGYGETHLPWRREGQTLAQVAAVLAAKGMMATRGPTFALQIARPLTVEDRVGS